MSVGTRAHSLSRVNRARERGRTLRRTAHRIGATGDAKRVAITDSLAPLELERRNGRRLVLSEQRWQRRWFPLAIAAAVVLGFSVRASYVLAADFPLNDGGLFYQMTRELQEAGYRLPAVTSYNDAGIPFSYPPAGFYVAGFLADLTPLNLLTVFRLLPLLVSTLTIVAFFLLARDVLRGKVPVVVAVVAFALVRAASSG